MKERDWVIAHHAVLKEAWLRFIQDNPDLPHPIGYPEFTRFCYLHSTP